MIKNYISAIVLLVVSMVSSQAFAILIDDAGVVGTIDHCDVSGCENSNTTTETAMANYLLGLAVNSSDTVDVNSNGIFETYQTGSNDYSGTLAGAFQDDSGALTGWTGYEYVLGKYDGQNAGFILYNVEDFLAAFGDSLPEFSDPIWVNGQEQGYQLSHWTGFNATTTSVPAPGAAFLLGLGLIGLVGMRKKVS
jgi:hypothetical protein